jgi:hypothetical protein
VHLLKDIAKLGGFGIAGAVLANRHKPHPVFPGISAMPDAQAFNGDPSAYLQAVTQWAQSGLSQLQQTQNPFGTGGGLPPQQVPQGG